MENLDKILESILFMAGEPVAIVDIVGKLDVTEKELKAAATTLKKRYSGESGIVLNQFNNKLQLSTNSLYAEAVASVLNPIRERSLSKATLETAAIIAYKQPITRLEIEEIRGVGCDYAISILLEHNLIEVVGRKDAVGRPVLFGTTDEFLKRFNISSISELPDYNALLEKVKIVRANTDSLYNEYDVPTDKIVREADGEALEEGGETAQEGGEAKTNEPAAESASGVGENTAENVGVTNENATTNADGGNGTVATNAGDKKSKTKTHKADATENEPAAENNDVTAAEHEKKETINAFNDIIKSVNTNTTAKEIDLLDDINADDDDDEIV